MPWRATAAIAPGSERTQHSAHPLLLARPWPSQVELEHVEAPGEAIDGVDPPRSSTNTSLICTAPARDPRGASIRGLSRAEIPQAISVISFLRQLGGAIGVAFIGMALVVAAGAACFMKPRPSA
jgi:hypothetical protein